jgi:hypothetical protein
VAGQPANQPLPNGVAHPGAPFSKMGKKASF